MFAAAFTLEVQVVVAEIVVAVVANAEDVVVDVVPVTFHPHNLHKLQQKDFRESRVGQQIRCQLTSHCCGATKTGSSKNSPTKQKFA